MKIKRICAIDSMYTLLQYLLLSSIDDVHSTFFFWRKGVSSEIKEKFKTHSYTVPDAFPFLKRMFWYYILVPLKWSFVLKNSVERYACDNLGFEFLFVRRKTFSLLEDGLLSYVPYPYEWRKKRFVKIKSFLFGPLFTPKTKVGEETNCKKIHLTGLKDAPILRDPRTEVHSLYEMWSYSSEEKREFIKYVFGVSELNLDVLINCKSVLLTQPFSEDGDMTEEEKILLYAKIVNAIGGSETLVIKPHPREKTDYKRIFPQISCLQTRIPIQLLCLCGLKFENVYTICSTAAFDFPSSTKVYYTGSNVSPILMEKWPLCSLENLDTIPPNIIFIPWKIN